MNVIEHEKKKYEIAKTLWLLFLCLFFLTVGNLVYHSPLFSASLVADKYYDVQFFRFHQPFHGFADFLWTVILNSGGDLLCVVLIALAPLVRIPRLFISLILACRSFLFGFCGAYIIGLISVSKNWQSFAQWLLFFAYHVAFFAVLICLAEWVLSKALYSSRFLRGMRWFLTVCCEISLVILFKLVYYFLISKI